MNKKKRELQQNELADALGQRIEKLKPHMPRILMIGGTILLAVVAVAWWISSRQMLQETRWREYFFSANQANFFGDVRGLEKVAEMFPDTQPGQLALLSAADVNYNVGASGIIRNRQQFRDKLKSAAEQYEQVVESSANVDPFIKRRASYALAYTYEALGRFDDAADLYRQLAEQAPDAPIAELANKGLKRVTGSGASSIYVAFNQWEPADIAPGSDPLLPQQPNISFPTEAEINAVEPELEIGSPLETGQPKDKSDGGTVDKETDASETDESKTDKLDSKSDDDAKSSDDSGR